MDEPIVVALAESLRGADGERVAAVSPRVHVAYVSANGEPQDDVADAQVIYRGFGLMPPGLRRLLPTMPRLRWIHIMGAGVDGDLTPQVVNSEIAVTRTRGLHNLPVSEWVMLQTLAVTKRLPELVIAQHEGKWRPVEVPVTIQGRTMGIVGFGEIGQTLAERARAFGLRVVGTRRHAQPAPRHRHALRPTPARPAPRGVGLRRNPHAAYTRNPRPHRRRPAAPHETRRLAHQRRPR